jgi:hypothetical protein
VKKQSNKERFIRMIYRTEANCDKREEEEKEYKSNMKYRAKV